MINSFSLAVPYAKKCAQLNLINKRSISERFKTGKNYANRLKWSSAHKNHYFYNGRKMNVGERTEKKGNENERSVLLKGSQKYAEKFYVFQELQANTFHSGGSARVHFDVFDS